MTSVRIPARVFALRLTLVLALVLALILAPIGPAAGSPSPSPSPGPGPGPGPGLGRGPAPADWTACQEAILAAEQEATLPAGMLGAIARTESGRRNPATGRVEPWPWALNAAGIGMHLATRAEAVATVGGLRTQGIRSIDVGCLQINLLHHPGAFASLDDAFEPLANARYAARFLRSLQARAGGDWRQAIAWYHSATPFRGEAYRARVLAALAGGGAGLVAAAGPTPPLPPATVTRAALARAGAVSAAGLAGFGIPVFVPQAYAAGRPAPSNLAMDQGFRLVAGRRLPRVITPSHGGPAFGPR